MKKVIAIFLSLFFFMATQVSAHVVVRPNEVGVGERLNFVVSVPTEEENPTIGVRLVLPEGLQSVRPNVKAGWNIELVKITEGDTTTITEIVWSGGNIPAEQRDEFVFSAQAPAEEGTLVWKAYQTYSNGTVVAWENDPAVVEAYEANDPQTDGEDDHSAPKPYSETTVVNDLAEEQAPTQTAGTNVPLFLSIGAIILSVVTLGMQLQKKK